MAIIDYDHNPRATSEQKLISLKQSIQLALNELTAEVGSIKEGMSSSSEGSSKKYACMRDMDGTAASTSYVSFPLIYNVGTVKANGIPTSRGTIQISTERTGTSHYAVIPKGVKRVRIDAGVRFEQGGNTAATVHLEVCRAKDTSYTDGNYWRLASVTVPATNGFFMSISSSMIMDVSEGDVYLYEDIRMPLPDR